MLALTTTSLGAIVAPPLPKVANVVTPLHIAACNDDASAARDLLTADSIAAVDNNGLTALHVAASAGADDVCEILLEAGTDPNKMDGFGWTPLRWATLHGHAGIVDALVHAGATDEPLDGLSAFELASAAGHVGVAATLIGHGGHRERGCSLAYELASEMGHEDLSELIAAVASAEGDDLDHQIHDDSSEPPTVRVVDAEELERDPSVWHDAFATSTPLLVRGVGEWSDAVRGSSAAELKTRWGEQMVTVAFSPDALYHRPEKSGDRSYVLRETPLEQMSFKSFVDMLPAHGETEFFAVSQSASTALSDFAGLDSPSASGLPSPFGALIEDERCHRRNMWVCAPPKVSAAHHDEDDSVLIQLSGTKRFTLVAPAPLHGLTAYPSRLPVRALRRRAAGIFDEEEPQDEDEQRSHFTLCDPTAPDLERFPLFRFARTVTVDVEEGCALLLPAYWYHHVESLAAPGQLNVAVNVWFDSNAGGGAPATLHRVLRERLHVDCTV